MKIGQRVTSTEKVIWACGTLMNIKIGAVHLIIGPSQLWTTTTTRVSFWASTTTAVAPQKSLPSPTVVLMWQMGFMGPCSILILELSRNWLKNDRNLALIPSHVVLCCCLVGPLALKPVVGKRISIEIWQHLADTQNCPPCPSTSARPYNGKNVLCFTVTK